MKRTHPEGLVSSGRLLSPMPATMATPPAACARPTGSPNATAPAMPPTSGSRLRNAPATSAETLLCPNANRVNGSSVPPATSRTSAGAARRGWCGLGEGGHRQCAQRGAEELHRGDRDRVAAGQQAALGHRYRLTVVTRDVAELQTVLASLATRGGSRLVTYLRLAEIKPPSRLPLSPSAPAARRAPRAKPSHAQG